MGFEYTSGERTGSVFSCTFIATCGAAYNLSGV